MKERIKVLSDEKQRYRGLKQAKNQNRKGSSFKDKKPQERCDQQSCYHTYLQEITKINKKADCYR